MQQWEWVIYTYMKQSGWISQTLYWVKKANTKEYKLYDYICVQKHAKLTYALEIRAVFTFDVGSHVKGAWAEDM